MEPKAAGLANGCMGLIVTTPPSKARALAAPPRPLDIFPIEIDGGKVTRDTGPIVPRGSFDESQLTKV